jgi:hypothetical protein
MKARSAAVLVDVLSRLTLAASAQQYSAVNNTYARILDRELKNGSAEFVMLALVDESACRTACV